MRGLNTHLQKYHYSLIIIVHLHIQDSLKELINFL
jgi:hypothetical protein